MKTNTSVRGTLSKHRGKWRIVISYYDECGNRKQKTFSTGYDISGNKRRAEQMLKEKLNEFIPKLKGYQTAEGDITIADWTKKYLDDIEQMHKVGSMSMLNYRSYYKHVEEYFKNVKVKDVTSRDIYNYYCYLSTMLSTNSIRSVITILKSALDYAVKKGVITHNPCLDVKSEKSKKVYRPQNKRCFTLDEVNTLLSVAKDEKIYPIILFAVTYGMRRGELAALAWDKVDFDKRVFHISRTAIRDRNKKVIIKNGCKTQSSERTCTMTDDIYNLLLEIKSKQEEYREMYGDKYINNDYDFVFTKYNGSSYTPEGIRTSYIHILKKNGLPLNRLHDLRHTAATLMFQHGADAVTVQHVLGHSTPSTTLNIYVHHTDANNERAASVMNNIFNI